MWWRLCGVVPTLVCLLCLIPTDGQVMRVFPVSFGQTVVLKCPAAVAGESNIVLFDAGTSRGHCTTAESIRTFVGTGVLKAVFISHQHTDHINQFVHSVDDLFPHRAPAPNLLVVLGGYTTYPKRAKAVKNSLEKLGAVGRRLLLGPDIARGGGYSCGSDGRPCVLFDPDNPDRPLYDQTPFDALCPGVSIRVLAANVLTGEAARKFNLQPNQYSFLVRVAKIPADPTVPNTAGSVLLPGDLENLGGETGKSLKVLDEWVQHFHPPPAGAAPVTPYLDPATLKSDVLLMPHHGSSHTHDCDAFFTAVNPRVLISSSGPMYDHPNCASVAQFAARMAPAGAPAAYALEGHVQPTYHGGVIRGISADGTIWDPAYGQQLEAARIVTTGRTAYLDGGRAVAYAAPRTFVYCKDSTKEPKRKRMNNPFPPPLQFFQTFEHRFMPSADGNLDKQQKSYQNIIDINLALAPNAGQFVQYVPPIPSGPDVAGLCPHHPEEDDPDALTATFLAESYEVFLGLADEGIPSLTVEQWLSYEYVEAYLVQLGIYDEAERVRTLVTLVSVLECNRAGMTGLCLFCNPPDSPGLGPLYAVCCRLTRVKPDDKCAYNGMDTD